MMNNPFVQLGKNSNITLPLLAFAASIMFWLIDAAVDYYIFGEKNSLLDSIFTSDAHELYMRIIVAVLFVIFTFVAQRLLSAQKDTAQQLKEQKSSLEQIVFERTRELETLATIDDLTMVYNRRKFNEVLEYEMERHNRYQHPLSLVLLDIDHFKKVNDNFGHQAGDNVLVNVAAIISEITRKTDVVGRLGGEEFGVILTDAAEDVAYEVAEKIRRCLENTRHLKVDTVTLSAGVAEYQKGEDLNAFYHRSDTALYEAKNSGRNRVFASSSSSYL